LDGRNARTGALGPNRTVNWCSAECHPRRPATDTSRGGPILQRRISDGADVQAGAEIVNGSAIMRPAAVAKAFSSVNVIPCNSSAVRRILISAPLGELGIARLRDPQRRAVQTRIQTTESKTPCRGIQIEPKWMHEDDH
jgi:hypothetical protein